MDDLACTFCQVLATGTPTTDYMELARCTTASRPVRQHWLVDGQLLLAEVAPLNAGHVLVIPDLHILAAALLTPDARTRFDRICRAVGLRLTEYFGRDSYLTFEHGTGRTGASLPRRVKCAPTEHAHVHVLPNSVGPGVLDLLDQYTKSDGYIGSLFDPADWTGRRAALEAQISSYHSFTVGTREGSAECSSGHRPAPCPRSISGDSSRGAREAPAWSSPFAPIGETKSFSPTVPCCMTSR